MSSDFPAVIELNVGGVQYTTSLKTLTAYPDSRLAALFTGGGEPPVRDSKGRYFLDRDGVLFRYMLDFLRDGALVLPECFRERDRLKREAEKCQLPEMVEAIANEGTFDWLMRSRIRLKLLSQRGEDINPKFLHEIDGDPMETIKDVRTNGKVLPVLALNEVFIGETISARVSHLKMRLNGSIERTNMKCSGICVCTGTGSTSWHLSINRITVQSVAEILKLLNVKHDENHFAREIADKYNRNMVFAADSQEMGYTIRDLISAAVWPQPKGIKSRGFARKLELESNCYDASLVVDGGVSFPFNDGTIVFLEIRPEDSLRTVIFNNSETKK